ncbi:MAG: hypothetical protein IPO21_10000 [Bacteroidales bacterium]|nr:hypothetical protein [Bacteroidales bacterium]
MAIWLVVSHNPSSFPDNIDNYQTSEGGIDYNAGLVGALGYVVSRLAPVDQVKFGLGKTCLSPSLGNDVSLCGSGQVLLNANIPAGGRTFSWKKDGAVVAGTSASLTVSQAGTYEVAVDSAGCIKSDKIVVSAEIPVVNLGADQVYLGSPIVLNTGVSGSSLTFAWSKNAIAIQGAATSTYSVSATGTYSVTVSGSGCTSKTDDVNITAAPSFTYVSAAPVIDGTRDNKFVNTYAISTILSGTPNAQNLSGTWSGVWDNTYVYIHVSITDNALFNDSGTSWYEDDGVEVFFDAGNEKATAYDANDFQLGFVWDRTAHIAGGSNKTTIANVSQSIVKSAQGYDLEIRIPWASINKSNPSIGQSVGFDIGVNDDDNGAGRENKIAWKQTTDVGWQNPSVFGTVALLGEVAVVEPIVVEVESEITITLPENTVGITATVSGGNETLSYNWTQISGASTATLVGAKSLSLSASNLVSGTYVFEISVTSPVGNVVSERVTLNVNDMPQTSQTIQLKAGWNFISFYVLPENTSVSSVLSPILSKVLVVKNTDGYYNPANLEVLQSIKNIEAGKAYLVNMKSAAELIIIGQLVNAVSVNLQVGWNMVGYSLNKNTAIKQTLAPIENKIGVVKNFDGSYKLNELNGITEFKPGLGYYIMANEVSSFEWLR